MCKKIEQRKSSKWKLYWWVGWTQACAYFCIKTSSAYFTLINTHQQNGKVNFIQKSYPQISDVKNIMQKFYPNFFIQNVSDLLYVTFLDNIYPTPAKYTHMHGKYAHTHGKYAHAWFKGHSILSGFCGAVCKNCKSLSYVRRFLVLWSEWPCPWKRSSPWRMTCKILHE